MAPLAAPTLAAPTLAAPTLAAPPALRFQKNATTPISSAAPEPSGPVLAPPDPALAPRQSAVRRVRMEMPQPTAPPSPPRNLVGMAMQQPAAAPPPPGAVEEAYTIQLIPPKGQRVFRLDSEAALRERIGQEARQRGQRVEFPPEPTVSTQSFAGRNFPRMTEVVEPGYVCYRRLFFEERNAERYDWDLGFIQPLVSAGYFYKDLLLLPYHYFTDPCRKFDCDAGYCLPGDPVPYLLYPPALSVTGLMGEAGSVLAVLALLP